MGGLSLVTVEGYAIGSVKQWVLKCDACFKGTLDVSKEFCPKCGNATLARLGVSIGRDGQAFFHSKKNRRINTRGTVFPIPKPKGGRQGDMLLREDQMQTGVWADRSRRKSTLDSMFSSAFTETCRSL